jgi:CobQ-like glutamine amidotransferase family enzyme
MDTNGGFLNGFKKKRVKGCECLLRKKDKHWYSYKIKSFNMCVCVCMETKLLGNNYKNHTKLRGLSLIANYTDLAISACR